MSLTIHGLLKRSTNSKASSAAAGGYCKRCAAIIMLLGTMFSACGVCEDSEEPLV